MMKEIKFANGQSFICVKPGKPPKKPGGKKNERK